MPVRNAEDPVRQAVEDTLADLTAGREDLDVTYHLVVVTTLEQCSDDNGSVYVVERLVWRLNLRVAFAKDQYVVLSGMMPYAYCSDGDPDPMVELVKAVWQDVQFSTQMLNDDLDERLHGVATEMEKE